MRAADTNSFLTDFARVARCAFCLTLVGLPCSSVRARTLHVNSKHGDNRHDGLTTDHAFRTIQRAADLVEPGDEVIIHAGIYFERVTLRTKGQEELPIVFRADVIDHNRVILTGADRRLRSENASWTLEDERLGLYSIQYAGEMPARVLYSGTDLYPYATLEQLKSFKTDSGSAPQHGHFYDEANERLFIRLHASGRYGSTNPTNHTIAVAPRGGHGFAIVGAKPSHVVIEGLTFETPGNSAILVEGGFAEIRRCWFVGCPYGIQGTRRSQPAEDGTDGSASHVTIAYCDFNEYPAFDDAEELLHLGGVNAARRGTWTEIWHRKTSGQRGLPAGRQNYENGIAVFIGDQWRIHHNHIHDGFEGLANDGLNWATNLQVHENVFARLCDNAVEVENHARHVTIYRNVMRDVFEPFSYQPLKGPPWPAAIFVHENLIVNSPEHAARWRHSMPHGNRGAFKIGISLKNWETGYCPNLPRAPLAVPLPGLVIERNTVVFPGGRLLSLLGDHSVPLENVRFARNVFATEVPIAENSSSGLKADHFGFSNNLCLTHSGPAGRVESQLTPGADGRGFTSMADLWAAGHEEDRKLENKRFFGASDADEMMNSYLAKTEWLPLTVGPTAFTDKATLKSLNKALAQMP